MMIVEIIILALFQIVFVSNKILLRVCNTTYNKKALIHALIAVATAIPISRMDSINASETTMLMMTLITEIYSGVFVSSLAKKHVTKTLIKI